MIGPTFLYMNPTFTCQGIDKNRLMEKDACSVLGKCQLIDHFTITADMHLYCDL